MALKRVLITGGAGFLGSHLCERLLDEGHEVDLPRQLLHRQQEQHPAPARHTRYFELIRHDVTEPLYRRGGPDLQPGLPGLADPLPAQPGQDHQDLGAWAPSTCSGWPSASRRGSSRPPPARSTATRRSTPAGDLLGPRQPDRPPLLLRRGEALRRDPVLRLSPPEQGRHPRSCASSTPTARACTPTTAGWSPTSSSRRCAGEDLTIYGDGSQTRSFCYVDDLVEGMVRMMNNERDFTARSTWATRSSSRSGSSRRRCWR